MAKPVSKYPARAVKLAEGEESYSGTLAAGPEVLKFESPGVTLEFTYEELLLKVTTARNSPVGFTHPDHQGWKLTAYEHRILREEVFRERPELRRQVDDFKARKEGVGRVVGMLFFVCGLVGLAAVMGWYFDQTLPRLVEQLDPVHEGEVGDRLRPIVGSGYRLVELPQSQAALEALLARLLPDEPNLSSKFPLKLFASEDPELFSLPNGDIYVATGVIRVAKGDAGQVAALLARELVHLTQRHSLREIIAQAGPQLLLDSLLGKSGGVKKVIDRDFEKIVGCNYPEYLQIATDELAIEMLAAANIDITKLETVLSEIYTWQSSHGWSEDGEERATSTHLPSQRQISAANSFAGEVGQGKSEQLPDLTVPPNPGSGSGSAQPAVNF